MVSRGKTTAPSKDRPDLSKDIAKAAVGFKPKFISHHEAKINADFKLSHVSPINPNDLPSDLHERLEAIASMQLASALGAEGKELDLGSISFTTTDVDAALNVSGCVLQKGLDKTAVVAVVATETEREASWSRLEGLLFHWACTDAAGGAWSLPPPGWSSTPSNAVDAGGAWQCSFAKQMVGGPSGRSAAYVLLLQLPLRGVLKSGGVVAVLKATQGQNTRWLKDAATNKDFFIDLTNLPVISL